MIDLIKEKYEYFDIMFTKEKTLEIYVCK